MFLLVGNFSYIKVDRADTQKKLKSFWIYQHLLQNESLKLALLFC